VIVFGCSQRRNRLNFLNVVVVSSEDRDSRRQVGSSESN